MLDFELQSEPLPETGQPVGLKIDTAPAKPPQPVTIEGRHGHIEKPHDRRAADLFADFIAKRAFERWPALDNFDAQGRQKIALGEINGRAG